MTESPVKVTRLPFRMRPDPSRVITRFFGWQEEARNVRRIERVMGVPEEQVRSEIKALEQQYILQHPDIGQIWMEHYDRVAHLAPVNGNQPTPERKLLIGAYFTMEYAIESAALFNPSIIPTRSQEGMPPGCTRFLMSLRATGEGHLSSIVFRHGVIDQDNNIVIDEPPQTRRPLRGVPDALFSTRRFRRILGDIGALDAFQEKVLGSLGDEFSMYELNEALDRERNADPLPGASQQSAQNMLTLAKSNYRLLIPPEMDPAEMVIFPRSDNESRGIEDLRLVRFVEDDGTVIVYGTYTAFNGFATFPTLMESRDPRFIDVHVLAGRYALNKGMALFPRRINGKYVMSGRLDGESLYVLESSNILVWNEGRVAQEPKYVWELSLIGNCGSPIETDEGWLLLTHGVGPMRQYCIGATLLDLEDPGKIIGRLRDPLIMPTGDERIGYVPNVVYTCGALLHHGSLVIPYAMSDMITTFALVDLNELLHALLRH